MRERIQRKEGQRAQGPRCASAGLSVLFLLGPGMWPRSLWAQVAQPARKHAGFPPGEKLLDGVTPAGDSQRAVMKTTAPVPSVWVQY